MAQLPLARLPFGKSIALPAAVQWLSALAWDGLVGLFGAQGVQLLFHVPFAVGVLIVLVLEGLDRIHGLRGHSPARDLGKRRLGRPLRRLVGAHPRARPHTPTQHGSRRSRGRCLYSDDHDRLRRCIQLGQLRRGLQPLPGERHAAHGDLLVDDRWIERLVRLDLFDRVGWGEGAEQSNCGRCAIARGRGRSGRIGSGHRDYRGHHQQRHERLLGKSCTTSRRSEAEAQLECASWRSVRLRGDPLASWRKHVGQIPIGAALSARTGSLHFWPSSSSTGSTARHRLPIKVFGPSWT